MLRDVAADAAIAAELTSRVEDRLAADVQVVLVPGTVNHPVLQIFECLALCQILRMSFALLIGLPRDGQLQTCEADDALAGEVPILGPLQRVVGKAQVLILLPAPVVGELGKRAESFVAAGEFALGLLGARTSWMMLDAPMMRPSGSAQRRNAHRHLDARAILVQA